MKIGDVPKTGSSLFWIAKPIDVSRPRPDCLYEPNRAKRYLVRPVRLITQQDPMILTSRVLREALASLSFKCSKRISCTVSYTAVNGMATTDIKLVTWNVDGINEVERIRRAKRACDEILQ